jgi:hypothetical protein
MIKNSKEMSKIPFMVISIFLFTILSLQGNSQETKRQKHNIRILNDSELELINDLSSIIKDSNSSFVISPLIFSTVDFTILDKKYLRKAFGFKRSQFKDKSNDTLLIKSNKYFKIVDSDSLIKYKTAESEELLIDPLLTFIKRNYGEESICYFHKLIFSNSKEYAIVQYWTNCGFLCGAGKIVLMKRTKERWIKLETLSSMIS